MYWPLTPLSQVSDYVAMSSISRENEETPSSSRKRAPRVRKPRRAPQAPRLDLAVTVSHLDRCSHVLAVCAVVLGVIGLWRRLPTVLSAAIGIVMCGALLVVVKLISLRIDAAVSCSAKRRRCWWSLGLRWPSTADWRLLAACSLLALVLFELRGSLLLPRAESTQQSVLLSARSFDRLELESLLSRINNLRFDENLWRAHLNRSRLFLNGSLPPYHSRLDTHVGGLLRNFNFEDANVFMVAPPTPIANFLGQSVVSLLDVNPFYVQCFTLLIAVAHNVVKWCRDRRQQQAARRSIPEFDFALFAQISSARSARAAAELLRFGATSRAQWREPPEEKDQPDAEAESSADLAPWVVPPTASFLSSPVAFEQYLLISLLGKGAFGQAFLAVRKADVGEVKRPTCEQIYRSPASKWVVKRFQNAEASAQEVEAAMLLKKKLASPHPNLLYCEGPLRDTEYGTDALVFEYCNAGDLRRLVEHCRVRGARLSLFEVVTIGRQLCEALIALKREGFVHGDVALRNVFLHWDPNSSDLILKLGDFGLCQDLSESKTAVARQLSSAHAAPEIDGVTPYDASSDVFSVGVVLYELMDQKVVHVPTRLLRFGDDEIHETRKQIGRALKKSSAASLQRRYAKDLPVFVRKLLSRPMHRPSIESVLKYLCDLRDSLDFSEQVLSPLLSDQVTVDVSRCRVVYASREWQPGSTFRIRIEVFDSLGQRRRKGGDDVKVQVISPERSPIEFRVEDLNNGVYKAHCRSDTWSARLWVTVNGLAVPGSRFDVRIAAVCETEPTSVAMSKHGAFVTNRYGVFRAMDGKLTPVVEVKDPTAVAASESGLLFVAVGNEVWTYDLQLRQKLRAWSLHSLVSAGAARSIVVCEMNQRVCVRTDDYVLLFTFEGQAVHWLKQGAVIDLAVDRTGGFLVLYQRAKAHIAVFDAELNWTYGYSYTQFCPRRLCLHGDVWCLSDYDSIAVVNRNSGNWIARNMRSPDAAQNIVGLSVYGDQLIVWRRGGLSGHHVLELLSVAELRRQFRKPLVRR